jgi:hypothetical protein
MTVLDTPMPRVSASWLATREAADADARSAALVAELTLRDPVIHDLGCGTGSMGRWLAPRLPGPQHWVLHDRDPDLLALAAAAMPARSADGAPVTVETRQSDIARLTRDDLADASLVTASAVLDLLTAAEVDAVAAACAGRPALLTLSVTGRVDLTPADPLDAELAAAFNEHQRRAVGGKRLLGPDAVDAVVAAFGRLGVVTVVRHSPWRLCAHEPDLTAQWLDGWLSAACEQRPALTGPATRYARRRHAQLTSGRLGVTVHHEDVLARHG